MLEPVDAEAVPAQSGRQAGLVIKVSPAWQKWAFYYECLGRVLNGDVGRTVLVDDGAVLSLVPLSAETEILLAGACTHPCIAQAQRDAGLARGAATHTPARSVPGSAPGVPNTSWPGCVPPATSELPTVTLGGLPGASMPGATGAPLSWGWLLPSATPPALQQADNDKGALRMDADLLLSPERTPPSPGPHARDPSGGTSAHKMFHLCGSHGSKHPPVPSTFAFWGCQLPPAAWTC